MLQTPVLQVPTGSDVALRSAGHGRSIRRLGRTRRQLLEELDRPALKPLPVESYVFAEWRVRRVGIDWLLVGG